MDHQVLYKLRVLGSKLRVCSDSGSHGADEGFGYKQHVPGPSLYP